MFRITKVEFKNICQYEALTVDVDVGLMAVCGRNGQGKTNFLRGLGYGLTGLVDGSWGSQQELQKDGTAEPGWVEVTIAGNGRLMAVKRYSTSDVKFPDSLSELQDAGRLEIARRRRAVNEEMEKIFGIPCALMFQICWGRQGQMDSLLTAPAAIINTFLATVFDTKKLEKLRATIKTQLDTVATLSSLAQNALLEAQEKLKILKPIEDMEEELIHVRNAKEALFAEHNRLREVISKGTKEAQLEALKTEARTELAEAEQWLKDNPIPAEDTDAPELPDISEEVLQQVVQESQEALETAKSTIRSYEATIQQLSDSINSNDAEGTRLLESTDEIKTSIEKEQPDVCRLCKGKISDYDAYNQERWSIITGYKSEAEHREAMKAKARTLTAKMAKDIELKAERTAEVAALKRELQELSETIKNSKLLLQLHQTHNRRKELLTVHQLQRNRVTASKDKLSELDKIVPVTANSINKFTIVEKDLTAVKIREGELINEIADNKSNRRYLTMAIEDNEKAVAQYETNKTVRETLVSLRDVFSQNRAQARYLRSRIAELNAHIRDYLELTDMPFTLYLDEAKHTFMYKTIEGFEHPAAHLSGAQRNISAVVLQMAILAVVQPLMNLFLIDEPSESLDVENKLIMASLFDRMNNMLPSIEGVMLIVTRDDQLIESCSNVLNISEE